jgi:hypothetical protein
MLGKLKENTEDIPLCLEVTSLLPFVQNFKPRAILL